MMCQNFDLLVLLTTAKQEINEGKNDDKCDTRIESLI